MRILIAFLPTDTSQKLERRFHCADFSCRVVEAAQQLKGGFPVDAVIAGVSSDNLEPLRMLRRFFPDAPLILLATNGSEELAVAALRMGAKDYLREPLSIDEVENAVRRCLGSVPHVSSPQLIGSSPAMEAIREAIPKLARANSNILITGETGTGKELVAELIHRHSGRSAHAMVSVNCAAIPESLFESELFGFERGAFTGAVATTRGQMEVAHGGTLFLDEIGELSASAQAKVLRAVERKEICRIGGRQPLPVDVRIVAATNRDLDRMAMADGFRRDLYFRLNVGRLHLPSLRDRRSDILELIRHLMEALNRDLDAELRDIDERSLHALLAYEWPGNVRELRNVLESACLAGSGTTLHYGDLPAWFRERAGSVPENKSGTELATILSALEQTRWNRSRAAERLSWSRSTLYRRMAKYRITTASSS